MAYSTFPSFAQFLLDGFEKSMTGGVQRTEMEDGYTPRYRIEGVYAWLD